jgi:hypothetical protein
MSHRVDGEVSVARKSLVLFLAVAVTGALALYTSRLLDGATLNLVATSSSHVPVKPPFTGDGIHVGLPFNWRMSTPDSESGWVDLVWGSSFPQRPQSTYNGAYFPFARDPSDKPSRLAYYEAQHPDWIVYKCDQKTPAYSFGNNAVPLDIGNKAVLDFLLATYIYPAVDKDKYDGIDFDNVGLFNDTQRCGVWKTDARGNRMWLQQYSSDPHDAHYTDTILAWANYMSAHIRAHAPGTFIGVNTAIDQIADSARLLRYFDLFVDEKGFTTWGSREATDAAWAAEIKGATFLAQQGKALLLLCEQPGRTPAHTRTQVQWCLSNYLLVKGEHTYANISGFLSGVKNEGEQDYGVFYPLPEYHAPIGSPTDDAHPDSGVYVRHFTNGVAYVNPSSTRSYVVTVPASKDLYGASVSGAIHLAPHTGVILLRA